MSFDPSDILDDLQWLSDCCGAPGYTGLHVEPDGRSATGICSQCKDHATFHKDDDE